MATLFLGMEEKLFLMFARCQPFMPEEMVVDGGKKKKTERKKMALKEKGGNYKMCRRLIAIFC